ncbi:hypothetical protein GCM10010195_44260 [Kitasatospora griseola]|nr:hypothetical protein GCM10010195_44260 [Kitasatospora griseola]
MPLITILLPVPAFPKVCGRTPKAGSDGPGAGYLPILGRERPSGNDEMTNAARNPPNCRICPDLEVEPSG